MFVPMRRISLALALLLLAAGCSTLAPPPAFRILQLNDVYKIEGLEGGTSGGFARVRTLRTQLERDGTPLLVLHAGDALFPSVMSKYLAAEPMVDVLNLLDGDPAKADPSLVITFGNHEFDPSTPEVLFARVRQSQFAWVSSNTLWCHPACDSTFAAAEPAVHDRMLLDVGGTRVGLFGLLYRMKKDYMTSTDPVAAASDAVAKLRAAGARVVIALTHEDMSDDVTLVKRVPGIDLVVGGHDHLYMTQKVGTTWIAKGDADAKSVLVWDVRVPQSGAVRTTPRRVFVDAKIARDPAVDAEVQQWLTRLAATIPGGNPTIGTTAHLLEGVEPAVRGRETALGNLLADVARAQMQTDVAFVNGGSIRINDNIPPGPITGYDMEGIFYYKNKLVACTLTGQQLLEILRNSVSRADAGDGRFLQISGIRFTYHARNGAFVVEPSDVTIGGAPLDLAKHYTAATLEYLYLNGPADGYVLFADATRPPKVHTEREADFRATAEAYIASLPERRVTTAVEGRIRRQ